MPLPLSVGFMAMRYANRMHNAPARVRPIILSRVYVFRVLAVAMSMFALYVHDKCSPVSFRPLGEALGEIRSVR